MCIGLEKKLASTKDMELLHISECVRINSNNSVNNNIIIPSIVNKSKIDAGTEIPMHSMLAKDVIVSAKVMVDHDKINKVTNTPMSKGYGFVEFKHHGHALICLRELNNNPMYSYYCVGANYIANDDDAGSKVNKRSNSRNRLIVEFSVENVRKVQILEKRKEHNSAQTIRSKNNNMKDNSKPVTIPATKSTDIKTNKKRVFDSNNNKSSSSLSSSSSSEEVQKYKKSKTNNAVVITKDTVNNNKQVVEKPKKIPNVNKQLKRKERKLKRKELKGTKLKNKSIN